MFSWIAQGFKDVISAITSLVDFLNPASENFFVYKLIDLLGDLFKSLFVPSEERINAIIDTVKSKFNFIETIKISIQSLEDIINNTGTSPKLNINVGATKYTESQELTILDLSFYKPFKPYGDLVLTGFIYAFFLWRFFISIPNILNATGGATNVPSIKFGKIDIDFEDSDWY